MKILCSLILLCSSFLLSAQPIMEMTPNGFPSVVFKTPDRPKEKLIEAVKAWAPFYNKKGYDVFDVTENSISVDGFKEYAYFYRNLGERYDNNIKYNLKITFNDDKTYTVVFSVKEVYAKQTLTKTTIADFYTPEGKIKEGFDDVKPSLEATANRIVKSLADFINQ